MAQAELAARKLQRPQLLPSAPCSLAVSVRARVTVGLRYSLTEALVEAGEAAAGRWGRALQGLGYKRLLHTRQQVLLQPWLIFIAQEPLFNGLMFRLQGLPSPRPTK